MAKNFTYRGYSLEELKKMSLEEFKNLVPARARRTLTRSWDSPRYRHILKKVKIYKEKLERGEDPKPIKTHWRHLLIVPEFVGVKFAVFRGNGYEVVEVKEPMIAHYLGEFVLT